MRSLKVHVLVWSFILVSQGVIPQTFTLSGVVVDAQNGQPIELATVFMPESYRGTTTNEKGTFVISNLMEHRVRLRLSYLGYESIDTVVYTNLHTPLRLSMLRASLQLNEVNVMATESREAGSSTLIQRAAIEHLQPTSLKDVLQLLPGALFADSRLNNASQVSLRQIGADANTALGTAILIDGVPLSNNTNMQAFYGASNITDVANRKNTVNGGVDLRRISTDHIEEVEVIRGIPSVRYGDLTSGAVIVRTRKGASPLSVRVKSDPLNKLIYAGKGFSLPGNSGQLHAGIDYTHFIADRRNPLDQFRRLTANINHELLLSGNFKLSTQWAYTATLDKYLHDPDLMNREDSYSANFQNFRFRNAGKWNIDTGIFNSFEYTLSTSLTTELMQRTRSITLNSPMGISLAAGEGENIGIYLPFEYLSTFEVDGKPLNIFAQALLTLQPRIGKTTNHVLLGAEYRYDKNWGRGSLYDITRPPYPTLSSSSRPRPPRTLPPMQQIVAFAENNMRTPIGHSTLNVVYGLRATGLIGVVPEYQHLQSLYVEPRTNVRWLFPTIDIGNKSAIIALKAGYGNQVKFPTLMQLYPEKAYFDITQLNYYSNNVDHRRIIFQTYIFDRSNFQLKPSYNQKWEVGFEAAFDFLQLDFTVFRELMPTGFQQQSYFVPLSYKNYNASNFAGNRPPGTSDLTFTNDTAFYSFSKTTNAAVVEKKGIEYQIRTRRLPLINTEIVVNGAWFRTRYDISDVRYKHTSLVIDGKYYPYVGIFNAGRDSRVNSRWNTNVFLNTHLPKQRLIFSTTVQMIWCNAFQMIEYSGIPDYYIDLKGQIHPFTDKERNNVLFQPLIETFSAAYFLPERTPISFEVNFRATKEISNQLRISFYVNRLIDYNPRYTTRFGTVAQQWVTPFMGAELQIKI